MKRLLDITGDVCPMTFVRVKMEMENVKEGEMLEVVLREDEVKNVMESVKTEGYEVLDVQKGESIFRLLLTR
ncbi:MAG: sulfurtransferase TusA family protein [Deltaproteobacteria bacterium]|jgi:tRNA 2-thiouridine synthesizing protein A|nr:sulfurtransferase TusA family protein [Deltaproteobacteria bacterium]